MGKPAGVTSTIFSLDNQGNAFFAGLLTADKIRANQIIGLETPSTTFPVGLTFADVLSGLGSSTPVFSGMTSFGDVSITGGLLVTETSTFSNVIAGVLLASDIQSPVLDSLRALIENVSTSTSFALSQFTSSSEQTELRLSALENVVASSSVLINSLGEHFGNGLSFGSPITATAGLLVDSLSALHENGEISIMNDVVFFGRPYFTADTGGFAVVKQGAREVHVTFDQEYLGTPVVQAGMVYDATSTESPEFTSSTTSVTSTVEDVVFGGDIRYVVIHVSSTGFIIRLNKPAPASISFSWIALAIRYPKLFESDPLAPISLPPEDTTPSSTQSLQPQSPPSDTSSGSTPTSSFIGETTPSSTQSLQPQSPPSDTSSGSTPTSSFIGETTPSSTP